MRRILVTGGAGQLAQSIKQVSQFVGKDIQFVFKDSKTLDITNYTAIEADFSDNEYSFCINCAAYTKVDAAETETKQAADVNCTAAGLLAEACRKFGVKLIHISTDFVFSGKTNAPYTEEDATEPLSIYGTSKLLGETAIANRLQEFFIIRTSWLYSEYGHNFMKTMLRLGAEREELSVVFDQVGTPTYAEDLANVIIKIIITDADAYGIYHYSNEGVASWYDFARAIFTSQNYSCKLKPIRTQAYPLPATRPAYSVLDKTKIKTAFNVNIPHWHDALQRAITAHAHKVQV